MSHVADNLRQWAERVQSLRLAGVARVGGYDPDQLAAARGYATIPLPVALWSLEGSVELWVTVMHAAIAESVTLEHRSRGAQTAAQIVGNNAHDGHHHLWDISRALGREMPGQSS